MSCGSTACISTETTIPTSDSALVHQGAERFVEWVEAVRGMYRRRRQRQALLELDDDLLNDVGLTRDQAEQEARKTFWK
jgi:uncharacterized protein YjiS (DUF1127 family)